MRARDATRLRFPLALKKLACVAAVGFKPLIYINQQKQKKKKKKQHSQGASHTERCDEKFPRTTRHHLHHNELSPQETNQEVD
jgi:hypothetical protein